MIAAGSTGVVDAKLVLFGPAPECFWTFGAGVRGFTAGNRAAGRSPPAPRPGRAAGDRERRPGPRGSRPPGLVRRQPHGLAAGTDRAPHRRRVKEIAKPPIPISISASPSAAEVPAPVRGSEAGAADGSSAGAGVACRSP